jgi:hypothetical protein
MRCKILCWLWRPILLLSIAAAGHAAEPADGAHTAHAVLPKPPIGRIFFSPTERHAARGAPRADSAAGSVAASERFLVDGAVSSNTTGRAVWINGARIDNSAVKKSAWTDRNGNVWFRYESLGTRVMRPGQTIDRSGKIEDLLPPGAVTRQ